MLLTVLMTVGGLSSAWAAVGDVTTNVDIDFSNAITDGVVTGTKGSMTFSANSFELGYTSNDVTVLGDVLRVGNGTGTVIIDENERAGNNDVVTITFDMWFGNLSGRYAGFDVNDAEGSRIGGFYVCKYNNATSYDDFGIGIGNVTSFGSGSVSNAGICVNGNKSTITLTLDYARKTMQAVVYKAGGSTPITTEIVNMNNTNPAAQFVVKSNYSNNDRRCWFDNLKITTTKGEAPTSYNITVKYQDQSGKTVFDTVNETVEPGASFTPTYLTTYNPGFYEYVYATGAEEIASVDRDKIITIVYTKTLKAEYANFTNGGEGTTPFFLDYDEYGDVVKWSSNVTGRYSPAIVTDGDNHYMNIGRVGNGDNGAIITSNLGNAIYTARAFTMQFDMKVSGANNQAASFLIRGSSTNDTILYMNQTAAGSNVWRINKDDNITVTLSSSNWYTIKLTRVADASAVYLTIVNLSNQEKLLSKKSLPVISENGKGLGQMVFNTARYYADFSMDNILVRDVVDTDLPGVATTYTINFVTEGGTTIKDPVVTDCELNEQVTATAEQMADFVIGDKKYVYVSGNETITTVADAASNVITLVFQEISKVNYSVKAVSGNDELATIIEGSDYPETEISYGYSQYLAKDGVLYQSSKQNTNPWWGKSFTLGTEDYTATVSYTATSTTGIVFCKEAEDIEGLSKVSTGNTIIRASNKDGAYAATAATTITTLPAGKYKIYGACYGNAGTTFNITAGNATVFTVSTNGNPTHTTGEEFTLTTSTDIVLQAGGNGGSNAKSMDYIIIQKTGEYVPPTIDITDLYLTNPSFETGNLTGWTTTNGEDTGVKENSNDTYKTTGVDGSYLFNTWWHGYPVTQTIAELPAATYKLSALITSGGGYQTLFANNSEGAEISRTTIQPTNSGEFNDVNILFTLANADNVTIGARGSNSADSYDDAFWYKADNFRLSLVLEDDATIPAAIVAKLEAANPVNQGTVGSVVSDAYTQAKSTFESNATLANYEAYLAAVATYNMSVAQYAAINSESGALPIESTDGWAISTKNGTLARNTWSTEGNSDGSNMTTPFIQDWVGSGTPLAGGEDGGKLYYRLLLNPGESYAVTALVRAFNESGTGVTGATYYVGDDEKSIDELGSACTGSYSEKGKFGTFSCIGTVGEDGVLEFGVKLASNSPINWLSIKDIVIKESSDVKPTGITLSQTSATLTTGDALTITATITPDDASDQTIQWTSSNEAVATVSGGVVAAVSAGTATITAKAVAGNNVTATATITVADAPAIANATAISGTGQYLLRNVASGKYLGQANEWGTKASLNKHGVMMTATLADGKYKLTGICGAGNGLASDGYCDNGTPVALTVTAVEGKDNVYTLSPADGKYITGQPGTTVLSMAGTSTTSTLAQWQFIGEAEANKNLSSASTENPVDVTYMIKDPDFSRNCESSVWTMEATNKNLSGGDDKNRCAESYHATFKLSQELNVPNGTYKMRAQAVANSANTGAVVYANDQEAAFNVMANGETTMTACSNQFSAGNYYTDWINVTVTDHKLTVGVKGGNGSSWCVWDNFELYMTGYTPVTAITATIDKNEIYTLTEPATITASVTPATASFTGVTYSSSDESVATVSADGVVTAVAAGQATITVKAEVENVEKTIAVTVIESVMATADDYAALNAAINSHVMGFLAGEYAPYNNAAESFATVTAAKAIDQTVDNLQSTVQDATQAISNATWVVNTEEVNAIYDGTFAAATNNGAPNGWRMSNNSLGGDYHSRAFVGDDRLVEFNDTKSGLFLRFDNTNSSRGSMYYYGDTEGYTMPLKANTYYRVTVDFAGWGSTGKPLRMNVTGPEGFSAVNQQYNTSVRADNANNTPQQFNIVFQTAGEGNYVINFQTPGADTNTHNVVISNLKLFTEPESSATLAVTAAKYGTFIAPFDVTLPEGVTAYTVTDGDQLTMTEVTNNTIPANTPVVVSSEEVVSETVKGYSLAIKDSYTMEALTGTYVDIDAPNGSYILQNQNGKVGFYKVDTSVAQPKVRANRAYLSSSSNARSSFLFENSEVIDGINAVKALTEGEALIYDMNGMQQPRLKKGMNIIRTKDGRTQKVMVK